MHGIKEATAETAAGVTVTGKGDAQDLEAIGDDLDQGHEERVEGDRGTGGAEVGTESEGTGGAVGATAGTM